MEAKSIANLGRVAEAHRHFLAVSPVHHRVPTLRLHSHSLLQRWPWRKGARTNPPALSPRLSLGLALVGCSPTCNRHLRCMHQKRPWSESHFVIPACLRTDIHLLPVFGCRKYCDCLGPPGGEAGLLAACRIRENLHATYALRLARRWVAGVVLATDSRPGLALRSTAVGIHSQDP